MVTLGELLDIKELYSEINAGYVRLNSNTDGTASILNYTEKAAYEGHWNNITLTCRGLIFDVDTHEVLARPFPKFFNYGQPDCPEIDLDAPAVVTDKMDGSLGILFREPLYNQLTIATRGSFTSDQAIHATELLRTKYAGFKPLEGYTYLFEIIYPENRIVCNYSDMDDLVFLGAVNIATGRSYGAYYATHFNWSGPKAETFPYETMRETLGTPPRLGAEGFVVHFPNTETRVKIKQEDYIALHRIVTGLNARSVWQAMLDDKVDELIEQIPDEFHQFIRDVESHLNVLVWAQVDYVHQIFNQIMLSKPATKKDFALKVMTQSWCKDSWALFNLWDGKDIRKEFLRRAKPEHNLSPVKQDEDSA